MEIDPIELYNTRLLVFLETGPQTNKYYQVLLSPEEFKTTSKTIGRIISEKEEGDAEVEICISDESYKLPDLMETHSKKQKHGV